MTRLQLLLALLVCGAGLGCPDCSRAEESPAPSRQVEPAQAEIPTLPTLTVIGELENPAGGPSSLDGELLRKLPQGNGTLTELLQVFPDVQLSDRVNSSKSGGEILQPGVSISGGKLYQNNFLIDGIGNNSLLDPAGASRDEVNDTLGHPFERSLRSNLVERVEVYDSNVPARFGGFTGGVIDARIRQPGPVLAGELAYRTTRSNWTRLHVSDSDRAALDSGGRTDLQNNFRKESLAATLDLPLTPTLGLLLSAGELSSDIPLGHLGGTSNQHRRQQDGLAKLAWDPTPADHLELSLSSTPYRSTRFLRNVHNSQFHQRLDGAALQGAWSHFSALGEARLAAAYRDSRQRRDAPQHLRAWAVTDRKDWGRLVDSAVSAEGGFGDLEKTQQSGDLKASFAWEPLTLGRGSHSLSAGLEVSRTSASFERLQTSYAYQGARQTPDILCGDNSFDCVENEQFFTERLVYLAGKSQAELNQGALFVEDLARFGRWELRPGLRLEHNDLMTQTNLAPRLAASYDLFGNRTSVLIAGLNRYYDNTLLTAKLREAKQPFRSESRAAFRNRPLDWEPNAVQGTTLTRFSELETPYSDELTLGLDQSLYGGRLSLKYVLREGHDELATSFGPLQADGLRRFTFNNLGRSQHQAYRLTWERSWSQHLLSLNATYQETRSNHEDYDDELGQDNTSGQIWYQGRLIALSDLPGRDHNRPWRLNLTYTATLPRGFAFTNITRFRSGYRSIENTGRTEAVPGSEARPDPFTGEPIFEVRDVYEEVRYGEVVTIDWKLSWTTPPWQGQRVELSLEALNLFNARSRTAGSSEAYELGRQFWAGAQYSF